MPSVSQYDIGQFKQVITDHFTLKNYYNANGLKGFRRFWNLFRTNLMRKQPEKMAGYLENIDHKTRLADLPSGSTLGRDLAKKLTEHLKHEKDQIFTLRNRQRALIHACLEMEAACRLRTADKNHVSDDQKNRLKVRLKLWNLPK